MKEKTAAVMLLIAFLVNFMNLPAAVAALSGLRQQEGKASGKAAIKPSPELIGNAYPEGVARVYLAGQWLRLRGACPVAAGEVFRTARGRISFVFDDGTRMDAGANSAVAFRAGHGAGRLYYVALIKGRIGINCPGPSRVGLLTPDNLELDPGRAGFSGGLFFDGRRTLVKTLSGGLIARKDNVRYAGLAGGGADAGGPPGVAGGAAAGGAGGAGSTAAALGIGGAMVAGAIAGVTIEQNRGWNEASPYRP